MLQLVLQRFRLAERDAHTVDAHLLVVSVLSLRTYPFRNARRALHALTHQRELGAVKLFLGSEEVARVGPQRCAMKRHHRRSGTSVEARNPLSALPSLGNIFAHVWVGTGEDKR